MVKHDKIYSAQIKEEDKLQVSIANLEKLLEKLFM